METFRHSLWFVGQSEPIDYYLPDKELSEDFQRWLQGTTRKNSKGNGFVLEHEGCITFIAYQYVARMVVEKHAVDEDVME